MDTLTGSHNNGILFGSIIKYSHEGREGKKSLQSVGEFEMSMTHKFKTLGVGDDDLFRRCRSAFADWGTLKTATIREKAETVTLRWESELTLAAARSSHLLNVLTDRFQSLERFGSYAILTDKQYALTKNCGQRRNWIKRNI